MSIIKDFHQAAWRGEVEQTVSSPTANAGRQQRSRQGLLSATQLLQRERDAPASSETLMGWNTALDGSGTTYYWHSDTGASQYEKPPDFDPATAQASGSYTAYQQNGQSNGSYGSSAYGA
eukprot:4630951-Pleurochrysis_carterae.AAC.1